jgi:hypothetical protein
MNTDLPPLEGPSDQQLRLSGQQRVLYKALFEKSKSLGDMYLGSLTVLDQKNNPDRLALAAHGLRELMEKFPEYVDMPVENKPPTLTHKVRNFFDSWKRTRKNSKCFSDEKWSGEIDSTLRKFLGVATSFFDWFEQEKPTRKTRTAKILRNMDPMGLSLPKPIEELRIKEWDECHNFFEGVSHHSVNRTPEEFSSWLTT